MVWETEAFGIVMLTRNEEGGRVYLVIPTILVAGR